MLLSTLNKILISQPAQTARDKYKKTCGYVPTDVIADFISRESDGPLAYSGMLQSDVALQNVDDDIILDSGDAVIHTHGDKSSKWNLAQVCEAFTSEDMDGKRKVKVYYLKCSEVDACTFSRLKTIYNISPAGLVKNETGKFIMATPEENVVKDIFGQSKSIISY